MSTDDLPTYEIDIAGTADGGDDRIPDLSPREALERWLDRLRTSKRESTISSYHYRLKHFIEFCEAEGIDLISDVTGWDLDSYETHRRGKGLEPLSLNKELGTLQQFLEYCARIELVDEELPEKVDPPDVPRDAHVDETKLETEDARQLLDYYENDPGARYSRAHALLALAWYGGPPRLGGIRALDLDDYHPDEQYVEYRHRPREETPLKNGPDGERAVGLPPKVCTILNRYIKRNRFDVYDDYGREPLLTSERGRPSVNAVRAWMYLATVPCLHSPCPHGNDPETCDFLSYSQASKCPSSRSPHQVRTGAITWMRNRGLKAEVISERANVSVRVIEEHYDLPGRVEEMEQRRRQYLDRLEFNGENGGDGE